MSSEDKEENILHRLLPLAVPAVLAAVVAFGGWAATFLLELRSNQRAHVKEFTKFEEEIFGITRDVYSSLAEEQRARRRITNVWCKQREKDPNLDDCGPAEENAVEFAADRAAFWQKKEEDLVEIWKGRGERL